MCSSVCLTTTPNYNFANNMILYSTMLYITILSKTKYFAFLEYLIAMLYIHFPSLLKSLDESPSSPGGVKGSRRANFARRKIMGQCRIYNIVEYSNIVITTLLYITTLLLLHCSLLLHCYYIQHCYISQHCCYYYIVVLCNIVVIFTTLLY